MSTYLERISQWRLAPFHLGTAVGPFGSGGIPVFFHILMQTFDVDWATLSLVVPAYMLAYAGMQLVSGSISDLTSRRSSAGWRPASRSSSSARCSRASPMPS